MIYINLLLLLLSFIYSDLMNSVEGRLISEGIVGGDAARAGQFRYMASIQAMETHVCGGAIIDDFFVLSAAQCFIGNDDQFEKYDYSVLVGTIDATATTPAAKRIAIIKISIPSEFRRFGYQNEKFFLRDTGDIAVLKLKRAVGIGKHPMVGKVNLPKQNGIFLTYEGEKPIVAGYGWEAVSLQRILETNEIIEAARKESLKLRYAETLVLSNFACSQIEEQTTISNSHLCAKMKQRRFRKAEGICVGDSGSPLVLHGNLLIAIADSSPRGCDERLIPALYTRVTSYLSFIENAKNDINSTDIRSLDIIT